jgi:hypothetical protein
LIFAAGLDAIELEKFQALFGMGRPPAEDSLGLGQSADGGIISDGVMPGLLVSNPDNCDRQQHREQKNGYRKNKPVVRPPICVHDA